MRRPARVRMPYVERLLTTLSARDWAIINTVHRLRLVSGLQLDRVHFTNLSLHSRSVMRWRVLKRLVDSRVLIPLERRIGTAQRGSDKLCYTLDSAGLRLARLRANADSPEAIFRRPRLPGERFVAHTLAVSELYVDLIERSRIGQLELDDFQTEPTAWVRDGLGGWLKPDAFAKLRLGTVHDYWWLEADLATESLPTVRSKLVAYLDFVARGQLGPDGVVPRVLIGVPGRARLTAVQRIVNALPTPADYMFRVAELDNAAIVMEQVLMDW
jgi:hypothetical protein